MGKFASRLVPLAASLLLGACASTAPGGRAQMTVPTPISSLSSSIDMGLRLAAASPIAEACTGLFCAVNKGFDQQVARLGARLAQSAYDADPRLKERIPSFEFTVADKMEAGSASDAAGSVVIYRGVRKSRVDEEVLAFLIAREMGHIIARHHDEKSAARLFASVIAQVIMPVASLSTGLALLAGSAASAVGTEMLVADKRQKQSEEADAIAMDLLARQGWDGRVVANALTGYAKQLAGDSWSQGLRDSLARIEPEPQGLTGALALNRGVAAGR